MYKPWVLWHHFRNHNELVFLKSISKAQQSNAFCKSRNIPSVNSGLDLLCIFKSISTYSLVYVDIVEV